MPPHTCSERERLEKIETRLGKGDVTLVTLDLKLSEVLKQTIRTNGRVSRLEKVITAVKWCAVGILTFAVCQKLGLTEVLLKII